MTTIIPFQPSNINSPQFLTVFDGSNYSVVCTWNVASQRYYINIYDWNGAWVITTPVVATPPARSIDSAVYDSFRNIVIVTMTNPALWPIPLARGLAAPGTIIEYTLESFDPATYNGTYQCLHINDLTFSYPMDTDPGPVKIRGTVSRLIDLAGKTFNTSTLCYRNGCFEISP